MNQSVMYTLDWLQSRSMPHWESVGVDYTELIQMSYSEQISICMTVYY